MKGGKIRGKNYFVFVFILLFAIGIISLGYFTGFWGKITGLASTPTQAVGLNITVGAPAIVQVYNGTSSMSLSEGPLSTSRFINFTVYHGAGAMNLNDTTAKINISFFGEETRENVSCTRLNSSTNYATYSCNITRWWYDAAGNWNVTASILDNNSNFAYSSNTTLYTAATTSFLIAPTNLTWPSIGPGATNKTSSNDPLNLSNNGNQPIGTAPLTSNITINATVNLRGEQNGAYFIFANNFSVATVTGGVSCSGAACLECGNSYFTNLSVGNYANVTGAFLPKGNYTINDGTTGQDQLYFCLRLAGAELISQPYSNNQSAWIVKIG